MFLGKCLRENQRGNRWTQGGERKEGGPAGKPLDAGRGRRRRENQRETAGRREGKGRREDQRETAGRREGKGKEGGRRRANSYKYNNQKKRRDYD